MLRKKECARGCFPATIDDSITDDDDGHNDDDKSTLSSGSRCKQFRIFVPFVVGEVRSIARACVRDLIVGLELGRVGLALSIGRQDKAAKQKRDMVRV